MLRKNAVELSEQAYALSLLFRAHRVLLYEVEGQLRDETGLTLPLWEVLVTLALADDDRLRMVDLTKRMCVSKSNVTQLIDKLDQQGLVARETSPSDRRLVYATLTERGRHAFERGTQAFNDAARRHFADQLTKGDIEKISSGLSKVISALEPESMS